MSILHLYIILNLTLVVSAILSMGVSEAIKILVKSVSSIQILFMQYLMLGLSGFSVLVTYFISEESIQSPMSQKFSSNVVGMKNSIETALTQIQPIEAAGIEFDYMGMVSITLGIIISYKILKLILDVRKTLKSFEGGFLYKRIGNVSIYLSSVYSVPYAFSFLGRSFVSIPEVLIQDLKSFKISSMHELQHIRNKDTFFAILGELLKAVFFINPILIKWVDYINLEQEFSCDEILTSQRGVSPQEYKNCLFKVANLGRGSEIYLVGATRFIFGHSRSELSRRIKKMSTVRKKISSAMMAVLMAASLSVVSMSAYTVRVHASLGGLSMGEVKSLVRKKDFSKDFTVDINKDVVKWVNKYARTKKGIVYTRKALSNYYSYKDAIDQHIKDYGHPKELAAIPFVESMYKNLEQPKNRKGAGLWQFIPDTARAYNLKVGWNIDERMDVIKETDAAMRYLGAMNLRFQDWRLAILSYNAGEHAVQSVVNKIGSRDVWKVMKSDLNYDKDYLAKVMAAAIVMRYPEIVK